MASTKAYITQAELMVMLAVALADLRGQISPERAAQLMEGLANLPRKAEQALAVEEQLQRLTSMLSQKRHVFFVGRGMDYALSMEAALKLKEVSYIFSEAYAAGELKHGPIALLKEGRAGCGDAHPARPAGKDHEQPAGGSRLAAHRS